MLTINTRLKSLQNSRTAAMTAAFILFLVVIFQFMPVIGLPYGHFAWGGQQEVLAQEMRVSNNTQ